MCKRSDDSSKRLEIPVSAASEVRSFLCAIPRGHNDTRETWLRRAGSFLGLTPRRARSVWYGEKIRIDADEYLRMCARMDQLKKSQLKRQGVLRDVDALVGSVSRVASASAGSGRDAGGEQVRAGSAAAERADDHASNGSLLGRGGSIDASGV